MIKLFKPQSVSRFWYFIGLLLVVLLLGLALFIEKYEGFNPCPLCMLQRYMMQGLGVFFLLGTAFHFKDAWRFLITFPLILFSSLGLLLSGRQVWLQQHPTTSQGDCGASLHYLFTILSPFDVLRLVWKGGMECAQVGWSFLHLSLAAWSFVFFGLFLLIALFQSIRR